MKHSNEELRKQVVQLISSGKGIKEIQESTGFSKFWIYKWYNRYKSGDKNWYSDCSKAPHNIPHKTPLDTEQSVVEVRNKLGSNDAFRGALAIQWEMEELGFKKIPPLSTINAILKRNKLIETRKKRYQPKGVVYPKIDCDRPNILHQADFLGPRYITGGARFYFLNLMDVATHRIAVEPVLNRHDYTVVASLVSMWKRTGLPRYLQLDNQLPFRGSNRYPRSFGLAIRLCLLLGIEPVFIPAHEPWRNGFIEKFGDVFQDRFFRKGIFSNFGHIVEEAVRFEQRHNTTYRYSFLKGKTPVQVFNETSGSIRYLPEGYVFNQETRISKGYVHLVRLIRSDRKLDIFSERFIAPKESVYEYLWCTIDVKEQKLKLFLDNKQIKKLDYELPKSLRCT